MGIKIINSFELNSPLPLDARAVANNINEMNELITKNFVVAGQMCYNKADNKLYVLKKNSEGALLSWHEVADSVDLDKINKVLPTDIAIKDNKLGLEHDNVWLTNQNAINLGDNMTYDATTKTLNAKGGGEGLNILSLNLKNCMNESDYNELVDYIFQQVVIAKVYNIILPDLTGVDIVKFAVETPVGNVSLTFYRNSKEITQFNWLCNWTNDKNFMQMVTITGNTDNNVEYIKYNGIDSGESVSPTLNLLDLTQGTAKTTLTEQEKLNLEKGLYNQVLWDSSDENLGQFAPYLPSKLISLGGTTVFALMDVSSSGESSYIKQIEFYRLELGEKNTSGEYPITITKVNDIPNFPFGTGGSSEIPTLSTIAPSMSDLETTVYSDDDIALIKKQKDNFIKVPFGTADKNTSELCYVFSFNNAYSLIDVAGSMLYVVSAFSESPTFLYFNLDETNKKLVGESYSALSATDTSLYVLSSNNQIYLTNQLKSGVGQALNNSYYFDKINGKSIIHEENTINNYTIPTITFED